MGSAGLKVNEPSMEEILASIRRIIADDQETQDPPEPPEPVSSPLKSVLDIAERHVATFVGTSPNEPVLGPWNRIEREGIAFGEEGFEPEEAFSGHRPSEEWPPVQVAGEEPSQRGTTPAASAANASPGSLLSREASASVGGAFDRLGASLQPSQPLTVEDLMREMLRPLLKAWLDDNLPPLVERLVRDEIERVTRCRG